MEGYEMNIGFISNDAKKKLMQNFCIAYRGILSKHSLYSTGTTGRLIEEATNLSVHKYLPGHVGGVQQLASQIEHNEMDLVVFFEDPTAPIQSRHDTVSIIKLCDLYNIPIATNLPTAEMLIKSVERGELGWREAYK